MSENNGKIIEFKPRKNKKLKTLDYVSPEKKELLRQRKQKKEQEDARIKTIKTAGIFFLICVIIYFFAN